MTLDLDAIERALNGEADHPFTAGDARALVAAVKAARAERDCLIRNSSAWHRKYDEDTTALKAERDRWYGKAIERAARINAMRDALEMFARIEIPHDATDGTRVATTHYCNHMVTAYMIRQAREALEGWPIREDEDAVSLRECADAYFRDGTTAATEAGTWQRRAEGLLAALYKYGEHTAECNVNNRPLTIEDEATRQGGCDCGLFAFLDAAEARP